MKISGETIVKAVAVASIAGLVIYVIKKAFGALPEAAAAVGAAINPLSNTNLASRAVNATGEALSGDSNFTLGGWFYDLTHAEYDANAKFAPPTTRKASAVDSYNLGEMSGILLPWK